MSNQKLLDIINFYEKNPVEFVRQEFGVICEPYQVDALNAFADPKYKSRKIILLSSAGVGKSATLAWSMLWFLLTKGPEAKGVALSMTVDNLRDGLWREVDTWLKKSPLLSEFFDLNQKRVFYKQKPNIWNVSVRTYDKNCSPDEAGRVLSGLHGKDLAYFVDESGAIVPNVGNSIDQGLGETQARFVRLITAGNPMDKNSLLYSESNKADGQRVWSFSITSDPDDEKRSQRVSKEWAAEKIKEFGREDPWTKVFVLGEFPDVAMCTLLDVSEVEASMSRDVVEDKDRELSLGVDVARFGADANVWAMRRGLMAYPLKIVRNARTQELYNRTITIMNEQEGGGSLAIDCTGGYGAGLADMMIQAGHSPHEINFGEKAEEEERFFNKRSEMYFKMADWVKKRGRLPNDPDLKRELTAILYSFDEKGRWKLESKEQIRKRLGMSPDRADALALTFAVPDGKVSEWEGGEMEVTSHREGDDEDIYMSGIGDNLYG